MQKTLLSFLFSIVALSCCYAQNNLGPKLTAMGLSGTAVYDNWSIQANVAGITGTKSPTAAINYAKYLFDDELNSQALSFVLPYKNNYFGASFQRYGFSAYNEIKGSLALAKKFGEDLSIGINGNFHQISISNYGSRMAFSIDAGAMYNFSEELTFGLSVQNPSSQKYDATNIALQIPTVFSVGASYKATNKLLLATSVKKDFDQKLDVSFGVDYKLVDIVSLRGGITAKPFRQYAGAGINYKNFNFDLALESHPNIGYTPQIGLCYAF